MQHISRRAIGTAAMACLLLSACAPRLIVRHEDPTAGTLEVHIDDERVQTLTPGSRWKVRLSPGWHVVDVRADGGRANPYTADGEPWVLWHDRGTQITISPPASRR